MYSQKSFRQSTENLPENSLLFWHKIKKYTEVNYRLCDKETDKFFVNHLINQPLLLFPCTIQNSIHQKGCKFILTSTELKYNALTSSKNRHSRPLCHSLVHIVL